MDVCWKAAGGRPLDVVKPADRSLQFSFVTDFCNRNSQPLRASRGTTPIHNYRSKRRERLARSHGRPGFLGDPIAVPDVPTAQWAENLFAVEFHVHGEGGIRAGVPR